MTGQYAGLSLQQFQKNILDHWLGIVYSEINYWHLIYALFLICEVAVFLRVTALKNSRAWLD